jgi:hypothetical protein
LFVNARFVWLDLERFVEISDGFLKLLVARRGESALLVGNCEIRSVFAVESGRFAKLLDAFVVVLIPGGLGTFSRELVRFFVALCLGDLRYANRQGDKQSDNRIFFLDFLLDVNIP